MERASHTLERIMAEALRRLPPEELPAAAWEFAAGAAVAEKTRVLACAAQLLTVEVPDATWRAQLMAMTPQFLARLNQYTKIDRIDFKIAAQTQPGESAAPSVSPSPARKRTHRKPNA